VIIWYSTTSGAIVTEQLRLFVGIDVGDDWTSELTATADALREGLGRSVRWVRPELYHVTVVFLGNQPPASAPSIVSALESAASEVPPFDLRLTELRRLGGHEHGALVAGVEDPDGHLQRFRIRLDAALLKCDIAFDSKRLVPHVTLGRPRGRSGPVQFDPVDLRAALPLSVQAVDLIKSDLLPTGPRYESLSSVRLYGA
jgi:RNA 2',3'-cyclic 3'-phosphodiesterase